MSRRSAILELAVLGLLHDSDLHGYEPAQATVRSARRLPCRVLRLALSLPAWPGAARLDRRTTRRRTRSGPPPHHLLLTAEGKEQFQTLMAQTGPDAWEDGSFDVHFAFFGRATSDVRLRILEGAAAAWKNDSTKHASRQRFAASAPTATPPNCTGTAWTPPNVRSAGCQN